MRPPLIILAGGKGTRLRSITGPGLPKPMVEIDGKPFLYWLISHYISQGFTDITISTGYLAETIESYPWPWKLKFDRDSAGINSVPKYYVFFRENRWIVNGDTFIPENLPEVGKWDSVILSCKDIDAGAQHVAFGKIQIYPVSAFYDIGTPEGLERFKVYFNSVKEGLLQSATNPV